MIDPNDYPRLKLTVGTRMVEVFNRDGQLILRFVGQNDLAAIRNGITWIDGILDLRTKYKDIQ